MRNLYNAFSSARFPKFRIVRFNANGYNTSMRLNLFSNANAKKDSIYNSILVPTFDNKSFYSNFTYKYFNLKWSKFEQKSNYYRYVKSPSYFPSFLTSTSYFSNSFVIRRRRKRVYKRRRIRYSVYFKNRFLRSTKSVLRSYRLTNFYPKKKIFKFRRKLLRPLARKKSFKRLFSKYWVRRPRKFKGKFIFRRKFKKKTLFPRFSRFYFRARTYKFRLFRFFNFKKYAKKLYYAKRYAYRKSIKLRNGFSPISRPWPQHTFGSQSSTKKIVNFKFFRRLAKRAIRRRYFFAYVRQKLSYRVRSRIFYNKFKLLKFLGFKDYLLQNYFNFFTFKPKLTGKLKSKRLVNSAQLFFSYFFLYPQKLLYSKNCFYFKFFSAYKIFKNSKFPSFRSHFALNIKQYFYFYESFKKFLSILDVLTSAFIPFKFQLSANRPLVKFSNRVTALQYLQRRKLIRNLRFSTYFCLFTRIIQLKRGTKFYRRTFKKLLKFIYRRAKSGRMLFFCLLFLTAFSISVC